MKLFRFLAVAALAMFAGANAQAGVVLSNMGNDGITPGGSNNGNFINNATNRYAVGFTTGSQGFTLDGLNALMQNESPTGNTTIVKFSIFSASGSGASAVPGSIVGQESVGGNVVDAKGVVSFDFTGKGVTLAANTSYFAVVSSVAGTTGAAWFNMSPISFPSGVNGSGFTYLGSSEKTAASSGVWGPGGVNGVGLSLTGTLAGSGAFPEPALTSLLCLGGVALIRRRMKK